MEGQCAISMGCLTVCGMMSLTFWRGISVPIKHTPWHEKTRYWTLGYWPPNVSTWVLSAFLLHSVLVEHAPIPAVTHALCILTCTFCLVMWSLHGMMSYSFWRGTMCADQTHTLTWKHTLLNAWLLTSTCYLTKRSASTLHTASILLQLYLLWHMLFASSVARFAWSLLHGMITFTLHHTHWLRGTMCIRHGLSDYAWYDEL